jgi:HK97 family phage prohead protease
VGLRDEVDILNRLTQALEVKWDRSNGQQGEFTGYASTFGGEPDAYGDVIAPGAFKASLELHRQRETAPALLWAHDQGQPVGKFLEMRETEQGLVVKGQLTMDVQKAQEAYALMQDGVLSMSIGYRLGDYDQTSDGNYLLKEIDLVEISLVPCPANYRARITSVKSALEQGDIRSFERSVRDALDLSARQVKALLSGGWSALHRDDDVPELEAIKGILDAQGNELKTINPRG